MDGLAWVLITAAAGAVMILIALPRRAPLRLQLLAVAAAIVALLLFSNSHAADYDPGGNPVQTLAEIMAARQRGEAVEIRGICYSACALKLTLLHQGGRKVDAGHDARHRPIGRGAVAQGNCLFGRCLRQLRLVEPYVSGSSVEREVGAVEREDAAGRLL